MKLIKTTLRYNANIEKVKELEEKLGEILFDSDGEIKTYISLWLSLDEYIENWQLLDKIENMREA